MRKICLYSAIYFSIFLIHMLLLFLYIYNVSCYEDSFFKNPQRRTLSNMNFLKEALRNNYWRKQGKYPIRWSEYEIFHGDQHFETEAPADCWGTPMRYESDGNHWKMISYGADGLSGGSGIEADLEISDTSFLTVSGTSFKTGEEVREYLLRYRPTIKEFIKYLFLKNKKRGTERLVLICFLGAIPCAFFHSAISNIIVRSQNKNDQKEFSASEISKNIQSGENKTETGNFKENLAGEEKTKLINAGENENSARKKEIGAPSKKSASAKPVPLISFRIGGCGELLVLGFFYLIFWGFLHDMIWIRSL